MGPTYRVIPGMYSIVFSGLGYAMEGSIAYVIRDWYWLTLALTVVSVPFIGSIW